MTGTRIAVCGGPYGNPYALAAFIADAQAHGAERLYCLGDLGGFGADVDALWPLLVDNDVTCVAGNYDTAIARADPDCGCGYRDPVDNAYAQQIYDYTLATTSREFAAWMGRLPTQRRERIAGLDVHLVHGSPLAINDFWWESLDPAQHRARVAASGAEVILCTHSGLPWQAHIDGTLVVNVGVLGKPANDGTTEVWYALLDLADGLAQAQLVRLSYDWATQAASMRAAGLPEIFVETIETGWWTTCLEVLPPAERSRGAYHLYRASLPQGFDPTEAAWADPAGQPTEPSPAPPALAPAGQTTRPVVPLFGSAYFPTRLWIYTNFHCNLRCSYCAVASAPNSPARLLTLTALQARVEEAVREGFTELYVTGGEPFLHPDIVGILRYAAERLPTTVLTNAMVLHGARRAGLTGLTGLPLRVQTSLDGARPATHDAQRGPGSWDRTLAGIRTLVEIGLPPRVALTETPQNSTEIPAVAALLDDLGLPPDSLAVRPLLRRGVSDSGQAIEASTSIPELTVSADGLHWHPAGADCATSPDMHIAGPNTPLAEGKRIVTERFFADRLEDGSLPQPVRCAV